jgi:hypothetical protein
MHREDIFSAFYVLIYRGFSVKINLHLLPFAEKCSAVRSVPQLLWFSLLERASQELCPV